MKVKELIEILKTINGELNAKVTDFDGSIDCDIEHIDHDNETVYILFE